jgi:hypothetical protein
MRMGKEITWLERYRVALKEELTLRDIMELRAVGKPRAMKIRDKVNEYCLLNDIELPTAQVPTELVFHVTGKDIEYYNGKMELEKRIRNQQSTEKYKVGHK